MTLVEQAYRILMQVYILFIEIRMLFDRVTRGYGDHPPLTRPKEEVTHGGRGRRGGGWMLLGGFFDCWWAILLGAYFLLGGGGSGLERERERRLLLSWAKAGKDSKEGREATRSEGDDLKESAARALMRHGGRGRGGRERDVWCLLFVLLLGDGRDVYH
jgi:hypothetical protein